MEGWWSTPCYRWEKERGIVRADQSAWLCSRLTGIEMESEIRGEFQCVARFVLGKPFSGNRGREWKKEEGSRSTTSLTNRRKLAKLRESSCFRILLSILIILLYIERVIFLWHHIFSVVTIFVNMKKIFLRENDKKNNIKVILEMWSELYIEWKSWYANYIFFCVAYIMKFGGTFNQVCIYIHVYIYPSVVFKFTPAFITYIKTCTMVDAT